MTNKIHPCLLFDGQAKAAADFYSSIFINSKITTDNQMVVIFELEGNKFMGLNAGPKLKINPSISLTVTCESINQTDEIWAKLIDGGKALMAIDKYPWSERYGWLQDKFGLTWQLSVANTENAKLKITPSMLFTREQFGKAEEAIHFYSSVFDNSSTAMMVHYPAGDDNAGKVMFSQFKLNNTDLIAMDGPGAHEYSFNEAVSFVVECETQEEIDFYWKKLTEGGEESMCGWLKDQFGVSWQIIPAVTGKLMSDPDKAESVMQEVMKMKKLDLETMLNA